MLLLETGFLNFSVLNPKMHVDNKLTRNARCINLEAFIDDILLFVLPYYVLNFMFVYTLRSFFDKRAQLRILCSLELHRATEFSYALHCMYCIALHCIALHCMHCIALH